MRGLSPEQMLLIADEVCSAHGETVRDFGALAAAAAVSTTGFHGVRVHATASAMAAQVADTIIRLRPLSGRNEQLAAVAQRILLHLNG
ncbi:hypothetical protein CFAEC_00050 [Corynebacterium faecale]|nr:hypothetical protein CFAEC_00050 [Corynebacterium faecale]